MITAEPSWHTEREWFVRRGTAYCGEVVYHPGSMRWHARPWRVFGRQTGGFFDTMDDAIQFTITDYPHNHQRATMKPRTGTWTPADGSAARIVTHADVNVTFHYADDSADQPSRQIGLPEWESWVAITRASLTPPLIQKR